MANLVDANIKFYGLNKNVKKLLEEADMKMETTYQENYITEGIIYNFRWNLDHLVQKKFRDLCLKYRCTFVAMTVNEPDFIQVVAVYEDGLAVNESLESPHPLPDEEWMNKEVE